MFRPGPPQDELELPSRFRFADFEVNVATAQVELEDEALRLEPKAFDLLLLLAANPGRVVEKDEIFRRLWGEDTFVSDNALTRVVAQLRQALGDRADEPSFIATVRTRGYRFLPSIEPLSEARAETRVEAEGQEHAHQPRLAPGWVLAAVVLVVLLGVVLASRALRPDLDRSGGTVASRPAASPQLVQRTAEAGSQLYPSFSPDGSQLVYAGTTEDGIDLHTRPVEGGTPLRLTSGGVNVEPAWSPDGRWIAYRDGSGGGIRLISPSGRESRALTRVGAQPAWSPDSRRIVFATPGGAVLVTGPRDGPASPSVLSIVEVESGEIRPLTAPLPGISAQGLPTFTTDGGTVVFATRSFSGGGDLWRIPVDGGSPENLTERWTEKRTDQPQASGSSTFWTYPAPAPNGRGIFALRLDRRASIVRIALDGPTRLEEVLTPAPVGISQLTASPNGARLGFTTLRTRTSIEKVVLERAAPDFTAQVHSGPVTLAAPPVERVHWPLWAPGGDLLLFGSRPSGMAGDIVITDREGNEVRVISKSPGPWLEWRSPTELEIGGLAGGYRVDVDTGLATPTPAPAGADAIVDAAYPRRTALSPTRDAVAYTAEIEEGRGLFVWRLGAQEPKMVVTAPGVLDYFPAWSSDGRWIVYETAIGDDLANELWVVAADGGTPQRVLSGHGPSWASTFSPDGELVAYAALRNGAWHLAVAGRQSPERLLEVPPEAVGYLRWPTWSDRDEIAYERMHYEGTVWTVEWDDD